MFNTLSGKVENLKLTDVKVEAWSQNQGANAFAKTLSGATVSKVALKNILVAGGNNTEALAGTAQNSTVSEVWAEDQMSIRMDRYMDRMMRWLAA